ncbi:extracellular solute-binding protein [Alphaproteobacteria bacterium]|jgi:multiple sugar transport system substrate-binding protein|nr:extracellular solute-binding protein [Alphaproteobacteria bacterium]
MKHTIAALLATVSISVASSAFAGTLVLNTDTSDAAPKKAFEYIIEKFESENPDVTVEWNLFDHEGYKQSIRNFLNTNPPDVANWYAGNRMRPFVKAGLFEDVSDIWDDNGWQDGDLTGSMSHAKKSMTIAGRQWGVPYTYYQWGVYYRKDIFEQMGIAVPTNWEEFVAACAKLKAGGVTPITIGTKYLWTAAGVFDYLNLRTNGYEFHMDLTNGKVPYTDPRVQATFDKWDDLVKPGYFLENHAAYSWQEALTPMVKGEAAMYVMGNFAVSPLREAGLTDDQLGFFQFPEITQGLPMAEEAPTDTVHIPSNAKNKTDAKRFLIFMARADVQEEVNKILGQLPINSQSAVADDKFLKAGNKMLNNAYAMAQFYDRDAPAEMASAGMKGFQEYMAKPERRDAILKRLEKARQRVYK